MMIVPSANTEMSVSKLKIIKNYLKITISQQKWFSELVTIGIDKDIINSINLNIIKIIV